MKKLLLSLLIGSFFASSAMANNGWEANNNIAGDDYWNSAGNASNDGVATHDLSSIYAQNVTKEVKSKENSVSIIRAEALRSAAIAFGLQAAFAKKSSEINDQLNRNSSIYDKMFNFGKLQIENGLLPPVISEGINSYNQPNANEVRASDKLYRIEFPARIVNVPPTWREYLLIPFSNPETPDKSLLPVNSEEREIWDEYAVKGWEEGIVQASDVFDANIGRLKRDFEGMIRYKKLYEQGLVTKPEIARSELGITGGGDEMAIGDRLIQLTEKSKLNPNSKKWSNQNPK